MVILFDLYQIISALIVRKKEQQSKTKLTVPNDNSPA